MRDGRGERCESEVREGKRERTGGVRDEQTGEWVKETGR